MLELVCPRVVPWAWITVQGDVIALMLCLAWPKRWLKEGCAQGQRPGHVKEKWLWNHGQMKPIRLLNVEFCSTGEWIVGGGVVESILKLSKESRKMILLLGVIILPTQNSSSINFHVHRHTTPSAGGSIASRSMLPSPRLTTVSQTNATPMTEKYYRCLRSSFYRPQILQL